MFRVCATNVARVATRQLVLATQTAPSLTQHYYQPVTTALATQLSRFQSTVVECATANDALKYSGYSEIDFTISEDSTVYDAVQKFAAFNIGCLVTIDSAGKS
jgi:hypothetical protein